MANRNGRPVSESASNEPNAIQTLVESDDRWNVGILIPRTKRGLATQAKLLEAAQAIFVRDGFLDAKITGITATAGVSSGTFYTYFDSKEAIFIAVIRDVNERMFIRAFVRAYREHSGLLAILEQVATFNPRFREMRRGIRQIFRTRTEKGLLRLQNEGLIDSALSVRCAAEALTSMVSNFCYVWLVLGGDYDEEEAIRTLTTIWTAGIGLKSGS